MKNRLFVLTLLLAFTMLISLSAISEAACPNNGVTSLTVGPENPQNGFPVWFQDTNGRAVELCLDPNFCSASLIQ